jgi:hypothetical protein
MRDRSERSRRSERPGGAMSSVEENRALVQRFYLEVWGMGNVGFASEV